MNKVMTMRVLLIVGLSLSFNACVAGDVVDQFLSIQGSRVIIYPDDVELYTPPLPELEVKMFAESSRTSALFKKTFRIRANTVSKLENLDEIFDGYGQWIEKFNRIIEETPPSRTILENTANGLNFTDARMVYTFNSLMVNARIVRDVYLQDSASFFETLSSLLALSYKLDSADGSGLALRSQVLQKVVSASEEWLESEAVSSKDCTILADWLAQRCSTPYHLEQILDVDAAQFKFLYQIAKKKGVSFLLGVDAVPAGATLNKGELERFEKYIDTIKLLVGQARPVGEDVIEKLGEYEYRVSESDDYLLRTYARKYSNDILSNDEVIDQLKNLSLAAKRKAEKGSAKRGQPMNFRKRVDSSLF